MDRAFMYAFFLQAQSPQKNSRLGNDVVPSAACFGEHQSGPGGSQSRTRVGSRSIANFCVAKRSPTRVRSESKLQTVWRSNSLFSIQQPGRPDRPPPSGGQREWILPSQ